MWREESNFGKLCPHRARICKNNLQTAESLMILQQHLIPLPPPPPLQQSEGARRRARGTQKHWFLHSRHVTRVPNSRSPMLSPLFLCACICALCYDPWFPSTFHVQPLIHVVISLSCAISLQNVFRWQINHFILIWDRFMPPTPQGKNPFLLFLFASEWKVRLAK